MKQNIVLTGLPGCGKSTLAPLIARNLHLTAVEMDEEIVRAAGKSIPDIFAQDGEAVFRDYETQTARQCAAMSGVIISTGGGVVLRPENMKLLGKTGLIVFIDRRPEEILGADHSGRPLLAGNSGRIFELYRERLPLYRKYADITIKNSGSPKEAAAEIIRLLREAAE